MVSVASQPTVEVLYTLTLHNNCHRTVTITYD